MRYTVFSYRRALLVSTVFGLGILQFAKAGPPFVTDDPEPVEFKHWEIYVASQHIQTANGWSGNASYLDLNYGLLSDAHLHLAVPVAYTAPRGGSRHLGLGDIELGMKIRLIHESEQLPQVGIYPAVEAPTGRSSNSLGNGRAQVFLPLWIQKSFHEWTIYGGAGYGINPGAGHQNWNFEGVVLQRRVLKNLSLGTEIYHRSALETDGRADTAINVGATFDFNENHHLLFSLGRSVDGPTQHQFYLAYQLTFGPK